MTVKKTFCKVCGGPIEHQNSGSGRIREFCSNKCKQRNYREWRKWAGLAVKADLVGDPEPSIDWLKG